MTWSDEILINKPPKEVWEYIEDPRHMPSWNPKVQKVSPISWSTDRNVGFRYNITYSLSGKANDLQAEFKEYRPTSRLVIYLQGGRLPREAYIEEIYELSDQRGGATLLKQTIVTHEIHMNIFLRAVIFVINRFGRPTGKKYLETLRDIIEKGNNNRDDSID